MNRSTLAASALLVCGLLTACSSSGSTAGSDSAANPSTPSITATSGAVSQPAATGTGSPSVNAAMITIKNFAFTVSGAVAPGAKIMVHNEDSEAHTVTADSGGAFDVMVPAAGTATLTAPSKAGTYKFHCDYHSNMHGSLTVG